MSKSMQKRLAVQRPPRFVAGFSDGSGGEHVRDTVVEGRRGEGVSVAVTAWGCSCCKDEVGPEAEAMAKRIAMALNVLDAVEWCTVIRTDPDGGKVIGPEGWAQLQNALGR